LFRADTKVRPKKRDLRKGASYLVLPQGPRKKKKEGVRIGGTIKTGKQGKSTHLADELEIRGGRNNLAFGNSSPGGEKEKFTVVGRKKADTL